ncbi:DNA-binding protein [Candidatus Woesearchaeota archaeon]|jgi:uncharacterized protein|nr:DNA-binding protein [Candidatus Woesearchaeota archaeon]MBT4368164.1 DNA-binding protein [Candidatus Woesearchaeota archaeon]MBT4712652.1 DNA-binding protein [Candidatus Woesearchaeota archaeon]MBT6639565.1 DNA-binding protein [Candidatus Woesearchaeota archaeon]MBT7133737.1 DNA-binding protein [Candidatus Woesearchaeota archaeon]
MKKKVIIDTNFLLIPAQFKIDIFSEIKRIMQHPYELFILDKTIMELNKIIEEQKGKDKVAAKLALQLIEGKVNLIKTDAGLVDDLIVELADENTFVCTQDMVLKQRLKAKKIAIICMRQQQYLCLV